MDLATFGFINFSLLNFVSNQVVLASLLACGPTSTGSPAAVGMPLR